MQMTQRITHIEPNEKFAYIGTVPDFLEKNADFTLQEVDSATTRISLRVKMKAESFRMKLFMNNDKAFKKAEEENLQRLSEIIESRN